MHKLSTMCCTHLEIWQDSLGEVKIKMSGREKLSHLTLKGRPWDERNVFWRCGGCKAMCGKSPVLLLTALSNKHKLTLSTGEVCICWVMRMYLLQGNGQAQSSPLLFQVFHLTSQDQNPIQDSRVKIMLFFHIERAS